MKFLILENYDQICSTASKYVCKRINDFNPTAEKPFVLGLPTGGTPLGLYRKLVEFHKAGSLSFKHVCTFNMDEYIGIPEDHPSSYHRYMWENFFKHIDINPVNVHIPDGNASDLKSECDKYEEKIKSMGGIELFVSDILGLGSDGHVAFNEPGTPLTSRTHVQRLNFETIRDNARFFDGDIGKVPIEACTVGVGTITDAREVLMLVNGSQKALAVKRSVESGISHMCSGSALQMHQNVIWMVDEEATLELKVRTYKHYKEQLPNYLSAFNF